MGKYTYKEIINKAKYGQENVKKEYTMHLYIWWCYYFAKVIIGLNQGKKVDVTKISIKDPKKKKTTKISRQIKKTDYIDMCNRLVKYVEKHKQLPNSVVYKVGHTEYTVYPRLLTEILSRILVYYNKNGSLPVYVTANYKVFTKPTEPYEEVYNYFIKKFGKFGDTIDGALEKIAGKGYGYYYDDVYSNKQSIDRMKKGQGVNCTDSCHVFYNIMKALIHKGKYKKVECLHVQCSGGDGHVRLRITLKDGTKIYRDPAAVLSSGDVTYNWCTSGYSLLAVDPSWFLENLSR